MTRQLALPGMPTARRCTRTCRQPGRNQAHCVAAGCHRSFASTAAFDAHRVGGHCVDPAALFPPLVDLAGLWAAPDRHKATAALAAKRPARRPLRPPRGPTAPAGASGHPRPAQIESEPLEDRS